MNATAYRRTCPTCAAPLDEGTAAGLCPRCLFSAALQSTPPSSANRLRAEDEDSSPSPTELAADFPELDIVELVGRGGMGAVYKARQPALDRWVALKILSPTLGGDTSFGARFDRARAGVATEAIGLLDRAIAADPKYALAHAIRARAAYKAGYKRGRDYEPEALTSALGHVDRALALDPALTRAHVIKGYVYTFQKNYGEARKMLDAALALDKNDPRAALLKIDIAEREGRTQEAFDGARALIERTTDPDILSDAYQTLASAYRAMREWDAVEDTHIARTRLRPNSAWARGNYASFLVWRRKYDSAISMAESALEKMDYPVGRLTLAEARAGKALQLASQKQFDLADEQLALARKADGRSAEVEHATALVLRDRAFAKKDPKLLDQAKKHLVEALAIDPEHEAAKAALDRDDEVRDRLLRGE